MEKINDFICFEKPSQEIVEKYTGKVPEQIIELWKQYGFGSMLNGYLRLINPEEYLDILKASYIRYEEAIPVFTTGMGDILVWENNYLLLLKYRRGTVDVAGGKFKFFFKNMKDDYFLEKVLDWMPYKQAIHRYGSLEIDECFGYTPLLPLGGLEKVENQHIFRNSNTQHSLGDLPITSVEIFVSDAFKERVTNSGLKGFRFKLVWESDEKNDE